MIKGTSSTKILIVDDSKTARSIVKHSFSNYDTEVLEAENGKEGLSLAKREYPDLIILDIMMPVTDGITMLNRMKSDQILRSIPVIMLTVESEREHVVKIARLGIQDYMIKPFDEDLLIEKAKRLIPLKQKENTAHRKNLTEKCEILIVEDKPNIVASITEGLKHMPWTTHSVASPDEALEFCSSKVPDIILMSLSFEEESVFAAFHSIKEKTKNTPIYGLCVKTAHEIQKKAQRAGFSGIITKPIDIDEVETRIIKSLNLDTSQRYFKTDNNTLIIDFPKKTPPHVIADIESALEGKIHEAVDHGFSTVIVDAYELEFLTMEVVKILIEIQKVCETHSILFKVVGNPEVAANAKDFEESQDWYFFDSLTTAMQS